jgi:predicted phosphodiesterase
MNVLRREWFNVGRGMRFTVVPLGDIHLGNAACDEALFKGAIERIASDESCYWLGMGDFCEFINVTDPRFSPDSLAPWIKMAHIGDLAKAQRDRFLDFIEPIASRCLGMIEGNHEKSIRKYYERDIYSDLVIGVKERGGFEATHPLALGVCGWMNWAFYMVPDKAGRLRSIKVNAHHGFVGGKLAGAKALNMQRWLWSHDADLVIFGHSHNASVQVEAVEAMSGSRVIHQHRIGCYGGTFMSGAGYAIEKGYFPTPKTYNEIRLRPWAKEQRDRIRVIASG